VSPHTSHVNTYIDDVGDAHVVEPDGGGATPVARLVQATKRFGATLALSDLDLEIQPGETHALLGRNGAGKSTAVAALTGLLGLDSGKIEIAGEAPTQHRSGQGATVSCLYQHSTLVPTLTVMENMFIDLMVHGPRRVPWRHMRQRSQATLDEWGIEVDARAPVHQLSFGDRQLVEVVRALGRGSQLVILDEPTAKLDGQQTDRLFKHMAAFQEKGVAFLFISHFLSEIFEVCDRATVMRDGTNVLTADVGSLSSDQLVEAMVGGTGAAYAPEPPPLPDQSREPVLVVRSGTVSDWCYGVDLQVRPGEIVGLAGAESAGATQFGEAVIGLRRLDAGDVKVDGQAMSRRRSVRRTIDSGISYVPEDRKARGIVPGMSVEENVSLSVLPKMGRGGWIGPRRRAGLADGLVVACGVKADGIRSSISSLSGGNQQKVVVGRALASQPKVLVLDTPTNGVDVASAAQLYQVLVEAARDGLGVLVISDSISELRLCHRVEVMFQGRLTASFGHDWKEEEMIAAIEGATHT
jgi:simple sugar transport system ATP-binding protein